MRTDDLNPFLDDLFAEARTEAPVHSFADTRKTLLAGLAIGGAGLLGAKFITSSILKSKFFIMSVSAVTILTSAVLVYTTGLKPTETVSENAISNNATYAVAAPEGNELPNNLFVAALPDVEPEDTTIVIRTDSSVDVQETVEEMLETILSIHIDIDTDNLSSSIEEIIDSFEEIDFDIDEEELAELKLLVADFSSDSLKMTELKNIVKELEIAGGKLAERMEQISSNNSRVVVINRTESSSGLKRRVFTITNETTDMDLEDFHRMATEAGMDVRYDCKVWSSKIRSLNMRLSIESEDSKQTTDIHIRKVKRSENFAHNIIWYENSEGQAVKFNTRSECSNSRSQNHNHNGNNYYNHNDCNN